MYKGWIMWIIKFVGTWGVHLIWLSQCLCRSFTKECIKMVEGTKLLQLSISYYNKIAPSSRFPIQCTTKTSMRISDLIRIVYNHDTIFIMIFPSINELGIHQCYKLCATHHRGRMKYGKQSKIIWFSKTNME